VSDFIGSSAYCDGSWSIVSEFTIIIALIEPLWTKFWGFHGSLCGLRLPKVECIGSTSCRESASAARFEAPDTYSQSKWKYWRKRTQRAWWRDKCAWVCKYYNGLWSGFTMNLFLTSTPSTPVVHPQQPRSHAHGLCRFALQRLVCAKCRLQDAYHSRPFAVAAPTGIPVSEASIWTSYGKELSARLNIGVFIRDSFDE
jgi:hypothetical protein